MAERYFTGVVDDPRTKQEKKKDWKAEELLAGDFSVSWEEKKEWKSYTPRNQKSTSSCVPQSVSKLLEINEKNETGEKVVFSASKPYAERTNQGEGSYLHEMLKYAVDPTFYTLESRIKSQNLNSDQQMEELAKKWDGDDKKIAKKYSGKSYLIVENDIDAIAHWVEQGYGVAILIYADASEWRLKYPKVKENVKPWTANVRHAVAVVDYGLIRGKKFLKIEDSALFGGRNERWVEENFIKERCYAAGFVFDQPNTPLEAPKWNFTRTLWYGMRKDTDVSKLQDLLKKEGFFPKHIPSTGNYLEITRQAVEKYQRHYELASQWELDWVNGRIVGPKTRRKLNE